MKKHYTESGYAWLRGMGKSGFRGATSDKRYIQILKYIGDHDGCTKMDVLQGIGSNRYGRGQYSDTFSALKISGLIDYDRQNNEYHITDKGNDVLENSYLNDMERTVTGRKKFESTQEKPKMKKLNITKEQFNHSRYFRNKYGELEYVSESGKLFKTNKGKVLMFNENIHRPDVEDLDVPVTKEEEVLAKYIEQCIKEELGIYSSCSTHNPGEEMHIEIFIGEDEYGEDTDLNELCDDLEKCVNQIGKQEKYDSGTEWGDARFSPQGDYIYGEVWPLEGEYAINPKSGLTRESTKKFGRKFNESDDEIGDAVQDAYDKYRACRTEPKICHAVKINADGTEEKVGISMTSGNSIGGIVKAIQDGRLRKVLKFSESTKKFGKKFKESHTDMSTIENKLATAFDAEIRTMTPDDIQVMSESALDETSVSTIFVLLQQAFASRKFTDQEREKLLNSDPKLISQMVLDMIDYLLPQSKGYQVLALGMAREAVKEMSDKDWRDIVEYALNNPDGL